MTTLDINQYYNDMQHVYDRLEKLENFIRYEQPHIQQAYLLSSEFYDFRDAYNSKSSFEFVDIKKN